MAAVSGAGRGGQGLGEPNLYLLDEPVCIFRERLREVVYPHMLLGVTCLDLRQSSRGEQATVVAIELKVRGEREIVEFGLGASDETIFGIALVCHLLPCTLRCTAGDRQLA